MKNKKILSIIVLSSLCLVTFSSSVSATGPTGTPASSNLPDAKFNSVEVRTVNGTGILGASDKNTGIEGSSLESYGITGTTSSGSATAGGGWFENNDTGTTVRLASDKAIVASGDVSIKGKLSTGINAMATGENSMATGEETEASGKDSTAMGYQTKATGNFSTAFGAIATASGALSTALGSYTKATGTNSTAMGSYTKATGGDSTAMGSLTTASGNSSTAMGYFTTASNGYSTAMGGLTTASGGYSTAMGNETKAGGDNSTAMGYKTNALSFISTAIGRFNSDSGNPSSWIPTDPLFMIGNGTSDLARANALTVLKNGDTTINGKLAVNSTIASKAIYGNSTTGTAIWGETTALNSSGVGGKSAVGSGVYGESAATTTGSGVSGVNTSSGAGVYAKSASGYGVYSDGAIGGYFKNSANTASVSLATASDSISTNGNITVAGKIGASVVPATASEAVITAALPGTSNANAINATANNASAYAIFASNPLGKALFAIGNVSIVGNETVTGTASAAVFNTTSDERLKTNIKPLEGALDKVNKLEGVYFNWKATPDKDKQIGFIAQKIKEVVPEVVTKGQDGYYAVAYSNLTALLSNAIKELSGKFDVMEKRVNQLEKENAELKVRLDKLEAKLANK